MADVQLVDLEVIKRYSLALRQATAPAEELLAALDASRETVVRAMRAAGRPGSPTSSPSASSASSPSS